MTNDVFIRGGHLLSQDEKLGDLRGDIIIRDGMIVEVGAGLPAPTGVEVVDAAGFAILPGFIDTHRHTWQTALRGMAAGDSLGGYQDKIQGKFGALYTPEDVYAGNLYGALGAGQSGITTLCDESHVQNSTAHTDAALQALRDSGIRCVFDYGWPSIDAPSWMRGSQKTHPTYVREIANDGSWAQYPLVTLQMMLRGPLMCSMDVVKKDLEFARSLGLHSVMHVAAGSIQALTDAGLMGADLLFIHACDSTDEELKAVADNGAFLSSSPNLELNMLGLGAPPIRRFMAFGLRPSLSIDVETSVSGDMFTVMRAALMTQTAEDLYRPGESELPRFTPKDVIGFATIDGAKACGLGDVVGSITPGKRADLIFLDLSAPNLAPVDDEYLADVIVASGHPGNVDSVIVDGRFVRRDNKPVDSALMKKGEALVVESRARLRRVADAPAVA